MNERRVGIIGCGSIAQSHCEAWRAQRGVVLAAGCDIVRERAEQTAAKWGFTGVYDSWEAMLAHERLDVVSVCTWPGTHAAATIAAIEAGVGALLSEKPMARSLGECDAMLAAAAAHGAKHAIGHMHRFMPANTHIRSLVAAGAIGQPLMTLAQAWGGLGNNGTHMIDRVRYWLSDEPIAWVLANVERKRNRHERLEPIEDKSGAIFGFNGGCRLILETDLPAQGAPADVYLHGSEGSLKLTPQGQVERLGRDGWRAETLPTETNQYAELLDWLDGGPEHRNAAARSRATIEAMMAVYESVRTRGLVMLPLTNAENPLVRLLGDGRLPLVELEAYDIRVPQWRDG